MDLPKYSFKITEQTKKRGIIHFKKTSEGHIEIYEGHIENRKPHGFGKYTFNDSTGINEIYIGHFKNGKKDGFGTLSNSKDMYTGQWKNNLLHGEVYNQGIYGEFKGNYVNGKRHGKGKIINKNGQVYEGQFKNGRIDGYGKMWHRDGKECEGKYYGYSLIEGLCDIEFDNNDKYTGHIKNNLPHGKGKWFDYKNKMIFDGNWKEGNLVGMTNVLVKKAGRKSPIMLYNNIKLDTFKLSESVPSKHIVKYAIPNISKYSARSQSGLKKFIKTAKKRALHMESGSEPLYFADKPSSFFFISAHGLYRTLVERGNEINTFYVPDGMRIIYLDRSEKSLVSDIDNLLKDPDFMKTSLIQRKNFRKICPAIIFSKLSEGTTAVNVNDIINKTIFNRIHALLRTFISSQKEFTKKPISELLEDIGLGGLTETFYSYGITHVNDFIKLNKKDLASMSIHLDDIKKIIEYNKIYNEENSDYKISIYDSKTACTDLELTWDSSLGTKYQKVGIYPLPNRDLSSNESLTDEYGDVKEAHVFDGGFIPDIDYKTKKPKYWTNGWHQWNLFHNTSIKLSKLVEMLPTGTVEHPCVYFVSACRSLDKNIKKKFKGILRQHSDKIQKPIVRRQISE